MMKCSQCRYFLCQSCSQDKIEQHLSKKRSLGEGESAALASPGGSTPLFGLPPPGLPGIDANSLQVLRGLIVETNNKQTDDRV